MKVKGIPYSEVKARAFKNPMVYESYLKAKREEEFKELLAEMREKAGLNSTQIAEKMGISQPAVSRLERNAARASLNTLERYAMACGVELRITAVDVSHVA